MKRIVLLLAIMSLVQISSFGQKKYEMVIEKTDGTETVINVEDIVRTYFREKNSGSHESDNSGVYLTCPDDKHPHMIDLGLPSGTKWACCNVGASTPEDYGGYFAWGETSEKNVYNWDTYQYGYIWDNVVDIGSDIAGTQYDAATANWGSLWRMPSFDQIKELLDNCSSTWTNQNGVNGRKFTGTNGGTIFLPAAGDRLDDRLYDAGSYGSHWSSTLSESYLYNACCLYFNSESATKGKGDWRCYGRSVRPVR